MSSRYSFVLTPTHLTPQPHNIPAHCIRSHHIASSHHVTPHHITPLDMTSHDMSPPTTLTHLTSPHNQPHCFVSPHHQPHVRWHHITSQHSSFEEALGTLDCVEDVHGLFSWIFLYGGVCAKRAASRTVKPPSSKQQGGLWKERTPAKLGTIELKLRGSRHRGRTPLCEKGATCRAMPPPKRSWAPARASRGFSEGRGRGSTEVQNVSWLNLDRSWHGKIKQNLGTTLLTRSFVGSVPSLNTILLLSSFLILVLRK